MACEVKCKILEKIQDCKSNEDCEIVKHFHNQSTLTSNIQSNRKFQDCKSNEEKQKEQTKTITREAERTWLMLHLWKSNEINNSKKFSSKLLTWEISKQWIYSNLVKSSNQSNVSRSNNVSINKF